MGGLYFNEGRIHISGNFCKVTKRKPKNWIDNGYKIIVPFDFKWRVKIGKTECTCTHCEEHYQPYYGISWFHSKDCEIMKLIEKRPQILNLIQYYGRDMWMIAQTD